MLDIIIWSCNSTNDPLRHQIKYPESVTGGLFLGCLRDKKGLKKGNMF